MSDYVPGHLIRRWYQRDLRLQELGFRSYDAYLRSPHWQAVKARFRASDQPQTCMCGAEDELQMHHKTYERLGAEELTDLALLCKTCHTAVHVLDRRGEMGLDFEGLTSEERAAQYTLEKAPKILQAREDFATEERRRRVARALARKVKQCIFSGTLTNEEIEQIDAIVSRAMAEAHNKAKA